MASIQVINALGLGNVGKCAVEFAHTIEDDAAIREVRIEIDRQIEVDEREVAFLDQNPDCVAVGGGVTLINCSGLEIGHLKQPRSHEGIDNNHLRGHTSMCHPAVMLRRTAALAAGGYRDYPHAEDLDLWLRLAEIGRLANLSYPAISYRVHAKS